MMLRGVGAVCLLALFLAPAATVASGQAARRPAPGCDAVRVAGRYLDALSARDFGAMWDLLSPAAQSGWGDDPRQFATYQRAKFALLRAATPRSAARQVDGSIAVWARLSWRGAAEAGGDGEALLGEYPLRLAEGAGRGCAVVDAGPTSPAAPVVVPERPAIAASRVPILMYHNISSRPAQTALSYGLTVTDADFAAQLAYLTVHGYHTITLVDLFDHLYYGRALPRRPIVLTFDDGYDNAYTDAFPLLRRYHAVGVFNVITGKVGLQNDGINSYATWDQLKEMARAGMEIESHTVYHEDLGVVTEGVARNEIRYSRAALQQRLGVPAQFLAYPSGEPFRSETPAAQARILALVRQAGYVGALLDPVTPSTLQEASRPHELPRVRVSGGESLDAFIAGL
jgi:peptidoglycan/xylan/chitin deacetylase (PgdA/CDA1 family)